MPAKKPTLPETAVIREMVAFDTSELSGYHKNPRRGDVDQIARSLETNGQYRPIVVNVGTHTGRPLEVLAGNHTLAGAKRLGWPTILAATVDVDDLAAARIVAADNRTADLGDYDDAVLADLLAAINDTDIGLDGTGYDEAFLDGLLKDDTLHSADMFDASTPDKYTEQFGVIVTCSSEEEQERVYGELLESGYDCKVVTV